MTRHAKIESESKDLASTETMSVDTESYWQTTRSTIRERTKFMFNSDLRSDVKFVVQTAFQGESKSERVIPAHKFVLSIGSPVFDAMLHGKLAETTDSIKLPDCEYDSLLELFRYLYSDEVILSGSNVMGVLYLAKKFMVPSLADKCTKYLQDNLDPSNVFSILPSAQKYEEKSLVDRCWKVIGKKTEEAVKSDGFATIERSLLKAVVVRDFLTIEEIELFKAVDLWATKACERKGLAADGSSKREILGEHIVKGIRFPTMKQEEFASVVIDSNILTDEEIKSIIKCLNSVSSSPVGFPKTRRIPEGDIQPCLRFKHWDNSKEWSSTGTEAITVSVSKDVVLHGVCLFGKADSEYSVELNVIDLFTESICVSKTGKFHSKLLHGEKFNYCGYKVLFDKKIILRKNGKYDLRAKISGACSPCGLGGLIYVRCLEVIFSFENSKYSTSATEVARGQFPELLFSLCQQ